MAQIYSIDKARKAKTKANARGMCQHGFHKWQVVKESQFDVKKGKLVTLYRCARCKKEKVTSK